MLVSDVVLYRYRMHVDYLVIGADKLMIFKLNCINHIHCLMPNGNGSVLDLLCIFVLKRSVVRFCLI